MRYTLYGLRRSYFTRKLEAALTWYGADFEALSKSADVQVDVEARSGTRQVPVLKTPENWMLADTTPVMTALDARFPRRRMFPEGKDGVFVHVLEEWFDEWLPRTALHYRWSDEADAEASALEMAREMTPTEEAAVPIAAVIRHWGGKAARATGMTDPHQAEQAVAEYDRMLAALDKQLSNTRFALGDAPCAVDAVIVGGLRAHFAADPAPAKVVAQYERVTKWLQSCDDVADFQLRPLDAPTDFARFVLEEMGGAFKAFSAGNQRAVDAGEKAFEVELFGQVTSLRARLYTERSRRMVVERIRNTLDDGERAQIAGWLEQHGLAERFMP